MTTSKEIEAAQSKLEAARRAENEADDAVCATPSGDSSLPRLRCESVEAGHRTAEAEAELHALTKPQKPRKHPEDFDPFANRFTGNPQLALAYVKGQLAQGPIMSFGSSREMNEALQALRRDGVIRYVKVKDGGNGWELVK